ncbi:hypothetical protein [Actinotalea sp. K2]|uniref:hypothetical protein n=1 Tax=Actinotalea sp. K2 TaxID=2939438 RepID=UPI0020171351|nr:hypothetical protein [Actinotalea sp. K2]MCL3860904.1 hypothetical protein [Actinotalea sp. K2]
MRPTTFRAAALCLALGSGLLLGCTPDSDPDGGRATPSPTPTPEPTVHVAEVRLPDDPAVVLPGDGPVELAAATSAALYLSAPLAVVAPADDVDAQRRAASVAVAVGAPMLLWDAPDPNGDSSAPHPTEVELERLEVLTVLSVGDVPVGGLGDVDVVEVPAQDDQLADLLGWEADTGPGTTDRPEDDDAADAGEPAPADDVLTEVVALERGRPVLLGGSTAGRPTAEPSPPPSPTGASDDTAAATATDPENTVPLTELAEPVEGGVVLTTGEETQLAAVATARSVGLPVLTAPSGDPRRDSATIQDLAGISADTVIGLSSAFGHSQSLAWKAATAATGVELPGGGQVLFPGRRMVALYGTPTFPALGLLGEQDVDASIARAQALAAEYQALTDDVVVPAFEMIATVASADAGADGTYSNKLPVETFVPWVEAAQEAGVYVVIDLQPGRTDFLTQARLYEQLLLYPNVGLALDPEWRLAPDQVHLRQIGSVGAAEINTVVDYLAELTKENQLPQKLLILHQFTLRMISDRASVDTSREELAVLIHADGQGSQPAKADTWNALRRDAPPRVWWGWKNFLDEDTPMLTPEQTFQVQPVPDFVSYQ